MKIFFLSSLIVFSSSVLASEKTLSGYCRVLSANGDEIKHAFNLRSDEMAHVNVFNTKLQVVNNTDSKDEAPYQFGFGLGELYPEIFRNPPVACPSFPKEEREACQQRNRESNPPEEPIFTDSFYVLRRNPQYLDTYLGQGPATDWKNVWISSEEELKTEQIFSLKYLNVEALCFAVYK